MGGEFLFKSKMVALKRAVGSEVESSLTTKAVEGAALTLQCIDNVHGCYCLPLGVFGVGDGVTNDVLQKDFQDASGLFVDQARDAFYTTTASQTANGRFRDALDVVAQHFTMALGTPFSQSFASFTASSHVVCEKCRVLLQELRKLWNPHRYI